jgi:hypothetical protein
MKKIINIKKFLTYCFIFSFLFNFGLNIGCCDLQDKQYPIFILDLQSVLFKEISKILETNEFQQLKDLFENKYGVKINFIFAASHGFNFKTKSSIVIEESVKSIFKSIIEKKDELKEEYEILKGFIDLLNKETELVLSCEQLKKYNEYSVQKENKEVKVLLQIIGNFEDNSEGIFNLN